MKGARSYTERWRNVHRCRRHLQIISRVRSSDAFGIGGGVIWQYDFGNKSYFRLFSLWGYGLTNFSAENLGNSIGRFRKRMSTISALAGRHQTCSQTGLTTFHGSVNPYPQSTLYPSGLRIRLECESLLFD